MKKLTLWMGFGLAALGAFAAGCSGSEPAPDGAGTQAHVEDALVGQRLTAPPVAAVVGASAFDARDSLSAARIGAFVGEPGLTGVEASDGSVRAESARVVVEAYPKDGRFLVLHKEDAVARMPPAESVEDAALEARSRELLRGFGVDESEIGRVFQVDAMAQTAQEGQAPEAPVLASHKTFIERAVGGVPVQGSRIVFTYDAAGRLRRMLGSWPTLAKTGHRLSTTLSLTEIEQRVGDRLAQQGLMGRAARSHYVYVPVSTEDGSVTLQLHAEAKVGADRSGGRASSPQAVLVSLE